MSRAKVSRFLGGLAGGDGDVGGGDFGLGEALEQGGKVQGGDGGIGDDDGAFLRENGSEQRSGAGQQVFADNELIGGGGERDLEPARRLPGEDGIQDPGGGGIGGFIGAVHGNVGLRIVRRTLSDQAV